MFPFYARKKHEEYSVETRDLMVKIESFSLLSKHRVRTFESRKFDAGGYTWKVEMNLNKGGDLSVYLSAVNVNWEVNAIFTFYLHNQITGKYVCFQGMLRCFNALNPKWGFTKLISGKKLRDPKKGFVVNDNCVFGAEVFVKNLPRIQERSNQYVSLKSARCKRYWELSPYSQSGELWKSEQFIVGDHTWEVLLCPEGYGRAKGHFVSICVDCDTQNFEPHRELMTHIVVTFKNKSKITHKWTINHWVTKDNRCKRYRDLIPIDDMKEGVPCQRLLLS